MISDGVRFYMLDAGESYPDPHVHNEYVGAYAIFPHDSRWWVQIHEIPGYWINLTEQTFKTENEAFNFAYEHHRRKLELRYNPDR
ncbi:hypothetical protein RQL62_17835 [Citrobacter amalonaticus]|nr:hypothetical protein [Citrobacter amalonaticus]